MNDTFSDQYVKLFHVGGPYHIEISPRRFVSKAISRGGTMNVLVQVRFLGIRALQ